MRITMRILSIVPGTSSSARKRAVNLTLSEQLVAQARNHTANLSGTLEALLEEFVAGKERERESRQQAADACAESWNSVHDKLGSFADAHSTL